MVIICELIYFSDEHKTNKMEKWYTCYIKKDIYCYHANTNFILYIFISYIEFL